MLVKRTVFQTGMSRHGRHSMWSRSRCFGGESGGHFSKLGCNIPTEHIEVCHRIINKKNFTVTVNFSRRKDCQHVKRDLRKIKIKDIDLPGQKNLFISKSLCLYYNVIWVKSKKLHSLGKIHSLFISGDTVKIRVSKNSSPLSLTHVEDFGKYLPDVDLSPPERSD